MRIGIVNDLRLACEALRRAVLSSGRHSIAWIALDGQEAIDRARADRPDLILMDLIMPKVDGVEATRQIMRDAPCPILVVTSTVTGNISKVYEAMGLGALDCVETPQFGSDGSLSGALALVEKIDRIGRMFEPRSGIKSARPGSTEMPTFGSQQSLPTLVLIGASTGGPKILADLLASLPPALPAAVVIAQHVDEAYACGLGAWLGQRSKLPVEMAKAGAIPYPGHVVVAASDAHLVFGRDGRMRYTPEPTDWYRPSVDALFASAARHWPVVGTAVLLTGMGTDGAIGMAALQRSGWCTIAQDKATSVVWGMPKAAIDAGAAQKVVAADGLALAIIRSLSQPQAPSRTRAV